MWNFAATFLRIAPSTANVVSPVVDTNISPSAATNNIAAAILDRNRNKGKEEKGGGTRGTSEFDLISSPSSLSPSDVENEFNNNNNKEKTTTTTTVTTTETSTSALTPEEYNKIREMAREEEKRGSDEKDKVVREQVREIIDVAEDIAASAETASTRTTTTTTTSDDDAETVSPKDIVV